jgi:phage N-6-adenine-methyltransferase
VGEGAEMARHEMAFGPRRMKVAHARTMPKQKPGKSKQDYGTPRPFLDAVEARFGRLVFDLAAHRKNDVTRRGFYYGPGSTHGEDALAEDWTALRGNLWLNPEFADINPWAEKCRRSASMETVGRRILFLVPASVGSEWWAEHVHRRGRVLFTRPRLSFDGKDPYPKDCALVLYGERPGYELWRWRP